jgi:hypothetical protein
MRQLLISFFLIFIVGFGVQAQNYIYTLNYEYSNNKFLVVTLNTTAIKNTNNGQTAAPYNCQSSSGMNFKIMYSYTVEFYKNNGQIINNPPTINTLQGGVNCENSNIFVEINDHVGSGQDESAGNYIGYPACENASVESLMCSTLAFQIHLEKSNGQSIANETISVTGTSTLPIELITFDAVKQNRDVKLSWKTASELNNDYFTIDRSPNGISWETVQTLPGAGNSSQISDYSWLDVSPYSGISYYRLKQTDYDGKSETFNIVSVVQNEVEELQAYPNPVSHTSTLLGAELNHPIRIFNTIGIEVTGNVNISLSPSKKTLLDMSHLPKGMYYVDNGEKSIQLSKQ